MCEYLCGSFRLSRIDPELEGRLYREAKARGHNIQLGEKIHPGIFNEIRRIASHPPPALCFNITSTPEDCCIEELLYGELNCFTKKPIHEIGIFRLLTALFDLVKPESAVLVLFDGPTTQWIGLERVHASLQAFLANVYEYHDRRDHVVRAIYDIDIGNP